MRLFAVLVGVLVGVTSPSAAGGAQERPASRVMEPRVRQEVKPQYTPAARAEGVEGTVWIECIVREDGTVGEARVTTSLHPDLDQEALRALAQWRFLPGSKDGTPVPVPVNVEMTFTLRGGQTAHRGPALDSPEVHRPGNGVTIPVLVRDVKPTYVPSAMRAAVQGVVKLECVVLPDGSVGDVRVVEKLHPQQDGEAVRTLQQWIFKPGTKDGVAVPVRVEVEMSFSLRSGPRR